MLKGIALGNRANRTALLLALVLGLLAAVLTGVYLSDAKKDSGSLGGGGASSGGGALVVVATREIPAGTRITAEMLAVKSVAGDLAIPQAFGKTEDVVGKVTRMPIAMNEQLSQMKFTATSVEFAGSEDLPLQLTVPPGMRGVSVGISNIIGAGGLIRPGDYVDVILTLKVEFKDASGQASAKSQVARTVIQNAEVLAIDQSIEKVAPAASGEQGGDSGRVQLGTSEAKPDATTVTLAVPPVHGEVLVMAETCAANYGGRLSLALRGLGDSEAIPARSTWAVDGPIPDCAKALGLDSIQ